MTSPIQKLQKIFHSLEKSKMVDMQYKDTRELREKITKDFIKATANLHELLLGERLGESPWFWEAEEADGYHGPSIAKYSLIDSGFRDAATHQPSKQWLSNAEFPSIKLDVDVFASYKSATPTIEIAMMAGGHPEVDLVNHYLLKTRHLWPKRSKGVSIQMRSAERDLFRTISNPSDLQKGWDRAIQGAQKVNELQFNGRYPDISLELVYEFAPSASQENMTTTFQYMGQMFATITKSFKSPIDESELAQIS
jgi:hypothetical protein